MTIEYQVAIVTGAAGRSMCKGAVIALTKSLALLYDLESNIDLLAKLDF